MTFYKITIIFIAFFIFSISSIGQSISWKTNKSQENKQQNIENISDISANGFSIRLSINKLDFTNIKINGENYYSVKINGFGKSLDYGNPQLPVYKRLIELPENANYTIKIIKSHSHTIDLAKHEIYNFIAPAQLSVPKIENPDIQFKYNKKTYTSDIFYKQKLVKINRIGKMRATSIARLEISPISYNPISNEIKIIDNIEIKITINGFNATKLQQEKLRLYSPFFSNIDNRIINSVAYTAVPTNNSKYAIKYVIIADSMFKQNLQPFIRWKEKKGFKVVEAYIQNSSVGTTKASIKAYIQSLYNSATATNPAPSYVLFVGDVAQIPAWHGTTGGSHVTDLHYCEFSNDFLPEIMYGRFSANDTMELSPQIEKTLEYEKYEMPDPSYLSETVLISGFDASGHGPTYGDGQVNYGVANYFNSSNNINCSSYLSVNGSYNKDAQIFQKINAGVSIANYTAHGVISGWKDPAFKVNDIANMTNNGKYPLMIGNACLTNHFNSLTCFGEGLMRAKNKGAIGYLGASDNTYWDEDYFWAVGYGNITANPSYNNMGAGLYDLIFHTHNEVLSDWAMSSYQYIQAGNMAVTQGGNYVNYYWEVYHVMGDPSLMAYQKVPSQITASFIPFIPIGATTYQVNTSPNALVAISYNDTLISSAFSDSLGIALLQLGNSINQSGSLNIVITAQNYAPYFNTIFTGPQSTPYIIASNIIIDDTLANNNSTADYNEIVNFDIDFTNITPHNTNATTAILQTNDPYITILNGNINIGNINSFDTIKINNSFKFKVDSVIPNQHIVNFNIVITDANNNTWTTPVVIKLYAPLFSIEKTKIDDSVLGNSNGKIEAGESITVSVLIKNIGNRDAYNIECNYTSSNNKVTVNNNVTIDTLAANNSKWVDFQLTFDATMTNGQYANIMFDYYSHGYSGNLNIPQVIGSFNEDFETGDLSKFAWNTLADKGWEIDSLNPYEGKYCLRSSKNITNNDTSTLSIQMRVLKNDSISFYRKTSTEAIYDKLVFCIDGNIIEKWSDKNNWKLKKYPVEAGVHTFEWKYIKDYFQASGQDATWIDNISFPPTDTWSNVRSNETPNVNNIKIWPNPTIDELNIDLVMQQSTNISISVFNQLGQIVIAKQNFGKYNTGTNSIKINVNDLQSGVYFVKIISNEQMFFKKFIVN